MENKQITNTFLEIREKIYENYVSYEKYLKYLLRLVWTLILFSVITGQFDYHETLSGAICILGLALCASFLPNGLVVFMAAVLTVGEFYFLSPVLAGVVALSCFLIHIMTATYDNKTVLAIAFLPILMLWKVPVLGALVLGLFFGPASALSLVGGTGVFYVLKKIKELDTVDTAAGSDILLFLRTLMNDIITNPSMYVMMFALAVTLILVYIVRRIKMKYSFEIAIVLGGVCYCIVLLVGNSMFSCDFAISEVLLGTIISVAISFCVHFCHMVLDYDAVEELQFEDESYYYYVKAIPKQKSGMVQKKSHNKYKETTYDDLPEENLSDTTRLPISTITTRSTDTARTEMRNNISGNENAGVAERVGSTGSTTVIRKRSREAAGTGSTTVRRSSGNEAAGTGSTTVRRSSSREAAGTGSTTVRRSSSREAAGTGSTTVRRSSGSEAAGTGSTTVRRSRSSEATGTGNTTVRRSSSREAAGTGSTTVRKSSSAAAKTGSTTVIRKSSAGGTTLEKGNRAVPETDIETLRKRSTTAANRPGSTTVRKTGVGVSSKTAGSDSSNGVSKESQSDKE